MDSVFDFADGDNDGHLNAEEFEMVYNHRDADYDYAQDTNAQDLWMRHSEGGSRPEYRSMSRDGFAAAYREGVEGVSDQEIEDAWNMGLVWGDDLTNWEWQRIVSLYHGPPKDIRDSAYWYW